MPYTHTVRGERFVFPDLRDLLAKANESKSGDQLAGIAARSERERVAAELALADVPLSHLLETPVIDPDTDDVSRLIRDSHDPAAFAPVRTLTVGEFRECLLDHRTDAAALRRLHRGVTPETAAAVAKLMGNKELVYAAAKARTVMRCRNTMGGAGVFGVRVQPNHPADDLGGILVAAADGRRPRACPRIWRTARGPATPTPTAT
jgi:ethanolamine ammonia-lyase large subunit